MTVSDKSTTDDIQESSEEVFAARVTENRRRVFQIAQSVLRNVQDAEEVAQEALFQAFRRLSRLRDPDKFRAWVGKIAFRLALNRRRSQMRRLVRDDAWQRQSERLRPGQDPRSRQMDLDEVEAAIDDLPEKLRVVLLLCAVEEMGAADVASILRVPVGTVRSRLFLARKRLLMRMQR